MFCTKLTLTHQTDATWHSRYLTDPQSRLSTFIQDENLIAAYVQTYRQYIADDKLLFRVKSHFAVNQSVVVLNVWDSEQSYNEFSSTVNGNRYFEAFTAENLNFTLEKIHSADINQIIQEALSWEDKLIQYIHPSYNSSSITHGDPLAGGA